MLNITNVTFYFANPKQDANGNPLMNQPPESHTLSWEEVANNAGFSLSTGESMFTELPEPNNKHVIRIINGFYFGTGLCGSLLAIQYHYEDGSEGWIASIRSQSSHAQHLNTIIGNWIKGLTYEQITQHPNWSGKPYIGHENDFVEVEVVRITPSPEPEPDPDPNPEPEPEPCDLLLTPLSLTIPLGSAATFEVTHSFTESGQWIYDLTLLVIEKNSQRLVVQPQALGSYSIQYTVKHCNASALLTVIEPDSNPGNETDPVEPPPPPLPNTPPDPIETSDWVIKLVDASKPIPPLYKLPNIMKRNARYRGHRESEKFLSDHQEQIYEIRQIYKDLSSLEQMKDVTVRSWFYGVETGSISMKLEENDKETKKRQEDFTDKGIDSIRAFTNDVIQLSGNSFEERIVGIYGLRQKMRELDERIAEAERRYREYENAYK